MRGNTKFLILGLLLGLGLSFFLSHFWSFTLCAIRNAVASGRAPLATGIAPLFVSKFLAGITAVHLLL
ncbi:MAG: hypothetical protein DMG38_13735 [Acidobacteria bacterium]|nr:MAG: hypothetical protein DMG38_13735 [Acidobacteriota bacterium]